VFVQPMAQHNRCVIDVEPCRDRRLVVGSHTTPTRGSKAGGTQRLSAPHRPAELRATSGPSA
jgi:hypothetical protein